ncbi:MAG TPA: cytochrome b/b6 domain-containing protein [Sphingomonadaceae bacterium]|nr:cytochrome b/b6 domain-containing protein [Sphingomonadaceae bacterium]
MSVGAERYSRVAIMFHWLLALLVAGEIALGFSMPRDASGFALYQLHKSIGITILLLTLARLGWRIGNKPPPRGETGLTGRLAALVHALFYVFLVATPLTGWAIVSTAEMEVPTLLFGVVPWPHLPLPEALNDRTEDVHEWLAFLGLALFALHVAGALRHQFLLKDRVLERMSPGGSQALALLLGGAVIAFGAAVFVLAAPSASVRGPDVAAASPAAGPRVQSGEEGVEAGEVQDGRTGEREVEEPIGTEAEPAAEPAAAATRSGQPPSWTVQPGGSLRFSLDNEGSLIRGSFGQWDADIAMDPQNPGTASITVRVALASATMSDATQTQMLQGENFFATAANPVAIFRSASVRQTGANSYRADGTLTLKGRSHSQRIDFTLVGTGNRHSVSGSGSINRTAFSVGTGQEAESLGAQVRVEFAFDAVRVGS